MIFNRRISFGLRTVAVFLVATMLWQDLLFAKGGVSGFGAPKQPLPIETTSQTFPSELGEKRQEHLFGSDELIINIQDAHASIDAQKSIAKLLENISSRYDLGLIGIEGSSGAVDPTLVAAFPSREVRASVAQTLLGETKISGAEFYKIVSQNPVEIFGVEDPELYKTNVENYQKLLAQSGQIRGPLTVVQKKLDALCQNRMPADFMLIRKLMTEENITKFDGSWKTLKSVLDRAGISITRYSNLNALDEIKQHEDKIDFKEAEAEKRRLIASLESRLEKKELEALVQMVLEFKFGRKSAGVFYAYLMETARRAGLDLSGAPNLSRYTAYMARFEEVSLFSIFDEFDQLKREAENAILVTDLQRGLRDRLDAVRVLSKLLEGTMTNADDQFYQSHKPLFEMEPLREYLLLLEKESGSQQEGTQSRDAFDTLTRLIPSAADFYKAVRQRNSALLENLKSRMQAKGTRVAALVTGGFHSEELSELMSQNRVSHLVILPKFANDEGERPYLTVITTKGSFLDDEIKKESQEEAIALILAAAIKKGMPFKEARHLLAANFRRMKEAEGVQLFEKAPRAVRRTPTPAQGTKFLDGMVGTASMFNGGYSPNDLYRLILATQSTSGRYSFQVGKNVLTVDERGVISRRAVTGKTADFKPQSSLEPIASPSAAVAEVLDDAIVGQTLQEVATASFGVFNQRTNQFLNEGEGAARAEFARDFQDRASRAFRRKGMRNLASVAKRIKLAEEQAFKQVLTLSAARLASKKSSVPTRPTVDYRARALRNQSKWANANRSNRRPEKVTPKVDSQASSYKKMRVPVTAVKVMPLMATSTPRQGLFARLRVFAKFVSPLFLVISFLQTLLPQKVAAQPPVAQIGDDKKEAEPLVAPERKNVVQQSLSFQMPQASFSWAGQYDSQSFPETNVLNAKISGTVQWMTLDELKNELQMIENQLKDRKGVLGKTNKALYAYDPILLRLEIEREALSALEGRLEGMGGNQFVRILDQGKNGIHTEIEDKRKVMDELEGVLYGKASDQGTPLSNEEIELINLRLFLARHDFQTYLAMEAAGCILIPGNVSIVKKIVDSQAPIKEGERAFDFKYTDTVWLTLQLSADTPNSVVISPNQTIIVNKEVVKIRELRLGVDYENGQAKVQAKVTLARPLEPETSSLDVLWTITRADSSRFNGLLQDILADDIPRDQISVQGFASVSRVNDRDVLAPQLPGVVTLQPGLDEGSSVKKDQTLAMMGETSKLLTKQLASMQNFIKTLETRLNSYQLRGSQDLANKVSQMLSEAKLKFEKISNDLRIVSGPITASTNGILYGITSSNGQGSFPGAGPIGMVREDLIQIGDHQRPLAAKMYAVSSEVAGRLHSGSKGLALTPLGEGIPVTVVDVKPIGAAEDIGPDYFSVVVTTDPGHALPVGSALWLVVPKQNSDISQWNVPPPQTSMDPSQQPVVSFSTEDSPILQWVILRGLSGRISLEQIVDAMLATDNISQQKALWDLFKKNWSLENDKNPQEGAPGLMETIILGHHSGMSIQALDFLAEKIQEDHQLIGMLLRLLPKLGDPQKDSVSNFAHELIWMQLAADSENDTGAAFFLKKEFDTNPSRKEEIEPFILAKLEERLKRSSALDPYVLDIVQSRLWTDGEMVSLAQKAEAQGRRELADSLSRESHRRRLAQTISKSDMGPIQARAADQEAMITSEELILAAQGQTQDWQDQIEASSHRYGESPWQNLFEQKYLNGSSDFAEPVSLPWMPSGINPSFSDAFFSGLPENQKLTYLVDLERRGRFERLITILGDSAQSVYRPEIITLLSKSPTGNHFLARFYASLEDNAENKDLLALIEKQYFLGVDQGGSSYPFLKHVVSSEEKKQIHFSVASQRKINFSAIFRFLSRSQVQADKERYLRAFFSQLNRFQLAGFTRTAVTPDPLVKVLAPWVGENTIFDIASLAIERNDVLFMIEKILEISSKQLGKARGEYTPGSAEHALDLLYQEGSPEVFSAQGNDAQSLLSKLAALQNTSADQERIKLVIDSVTDRIDATRHSRRSSLVSDYNVFLNRAARWVIAAVLVSMAGVALAVWALALGWRNFRARRLAHRLNSVPVNILYRELIQKIDAAGGQEGARLSGFERAKDLLAVWRKHLKADGINLHEIDHYDPALAIARQILSLEGLLFDHQTTKDLMGMPLVSLQQVFSQVREMAELTMQRILYDVMAETTTSGDLSSSKYNTMVNFFNAFDAIRQAANMDTWVYEVPAAKAQNNLSYLADLMMNPPTAIADYFNWLPKPLKTILPYLYLAPVTVFLICSHLHVGGFGLMTAATVTFTMGMAIHGPGKISYLFFYYLANGIVRNTHLLSLAWRIATSLFHRYKAEGMVLANRAVPEEVYADISRVIHQSRVNFSRSLERVIKTKKSLAAPKTAELRRKIVGRFWQLGVVSIPMVLYHFFNYMGLRVYLDWVDVKAGWIITMAVMMIIHYPSTLLSWSDGGAYRKSELRSRVFREKLAELAPSDRIGNLSSEENFHQVGMEIEMQRTIHALRREMSKDNPPSFDVVVVPVSRTFSSAQKQSFDEMLKPFIRDDVAIIYWTPPIVGSGIEYVGGHLALRDWLLNDYAVDRALQARHPNLGAPLHRISPLIITSDIYDPSVASLAVGQFNVPTPIRFEGTPMDVGPLQIAAASKNAYSLRRTEQRGGAHATVADLTVHYEGPAPKSLRPGLTLRVTRKTEKSFMLSDDRFGRGVPLTEGPGNPSARALLQVADMDGLKQVAQEYEVSDWNFKLPRRRQFPVFYQLVENFTNDGACVSYRNFVASLGQRIMDLTGEGDSELSLPLSQGLRIVRHDDTVVSTGPRKDLEVDLEHDVLGPMIHVKNGGKAADLVDERLSWLDPALQADKQVRDFYQRLYEFYDEHAEYLKRLPIWILDPDIASEGGDSMRLEDWIRDNGGMDSLARLGFEREEIEGLGPVFFHDKLVNDGSGEPQYVTWFLRAVPKPGGGFTVDDPVNRRAILGIDEEKFLTAFFGPDGSSLAPAEVTSGKDLRFYPMADSKKKSRSAAKKLLTTIGKALSKDKGLKKRVVLRNASSWGEVAAGQAPIRMVSFNEIVSFSGKGLESDSWASEASNDSGVSFNVGARLATETMSKQILTTIRFDEIENPLAPNEIGIVNENIQRLKTEQNILTYILRKTFVNGVLASDIQAALSKVGFQIGRGIRADVKAKWVDKPHITNGRIIEYSVVYEVHLTGQDGGRAHWRIEVSDKKTRVRSIKTSEPAQASQIVTIEAPETPSFSHRSARTVRVPVIPAGALDEGSDPDFIILDELVIPPPPAPATIRDMAGFRILRLEAAKDPAWALANLLGIHKVFIRLQEPGKFGELQNSMSAIVQIAQDEFLRTLEPPFLTLADSFRAAGQDLEPADVAEKMKALRTDAKRRARIFNDVGPLPGPTKDSVKEDLSHFFEKSDRIVREIIEEKNKKDISRQRKIGFQIFYGGLGVLGLTAFDVKPLYSAIAITLGFAWWNWWGEGIKNRIVDSMYERVFMQDKGYRESKQSKNGSSASSKNPSVKGARLAQWGRRAFLQALATTAAALNPLGAFLPSRLQAATVREDELAGTFMQRFGELVGNSPASAASEINWSEDEIKVIEKIGQLFGFTWDRGLLPKNNEVIEYLARHMTNFKLAQDDNRRLLRLKQFHEWLLSNNKAAKATKKMSDPVQILNPLIGNVTSPEPSNEMLVDVQTRSALNLLEQAEAYVAPTTMQRAYKASSNLRWTTLANELKQTSAAQGVSGETMLKWRFQRAMQVLFIATTVENLGGVSYGVSLEGQAFLQQKVQELQRFDEELLKKIDPEVTARRFGWNHGTLKAFLSGLNHLIDETSYPDAWRDVKLSRSLGQAPSLMRYWLSASRQRREFPFDGQQFSFSVLHADQLASFADQAQIPEMVSEQVEALKAGVNDLLKKTSDLMPYAPATAQNSASTSATINPKDLISLMLTADQKDLPGETTLVQFAQGVRELVQAIAMTNRPADSQSVTLAQTQVSQALDIPQMMPIPLSQESLGEKEEISGRQRLAERIVQWMIIRGMDVTDVNLQTSIARQISNRFQDGTADLILKKYSHDYGALATSSVFTDFLTGTFVDWQEPDFQRFAKDAKDHLNAYPQPLRERMRASLNVLEILNQLYDEKGNLNPRGLISIKTELTRELSGGAMPSGSDFNSDIAGYQRMYLNYFFNREVVGDAWTGKLVFKNDEELVQNIHLFKAKVYLLLVAQAREEIFRVLADEMLAFAGPRQEAWMGNYQADLLTAEAEAWPKIQPVFGDLASAEGYLHVDGARELLRRVASQFLEDPSLVQPALDFIADKNFREQELAIYRGLNGLAPNSSVDPFSFFDFVFNRAMLRVTNPDDYQLETGRFESAIKNRNKSDFLSKIRSAVRAIVRKFREKEGKAVLGEGGVDEQGFVLVRAAVLRPNQTRDEDILRALQVMPDILRDRTIYEDTVETAGKFWFWLGGTEDQFTTNPKALLFLAQYVHVGLGEIKDGDVLKDQQDRLRQWNQNVANFLVRANNDPNLRTQLIEALSEGLDGDNKGRELAESLFDYTLSPELSEKLRNFISPPQGARLAGSTMVKATAPSVRSELLIGIPLGFYDSPEVMADSLSRTVTEIRSAAQTLNIINPEVLLISAVPFSANIRRFLRERIAQENPGISLDFAVGPARETIQSRSTGGVNAVLLDAGIAYRGVRDSLAIFNILRQQVQGPNARVFESRIKQDLLTGNARIGSVLSEISPATLAILNLPGVHREDVMLSDKALDRASRVDGLSYRVVAVRFGMFLGQDTDLALQTRAIQIQEQSIREQLNGRSLVQKLWVVTGAEQESFRRAVDEGTIAASDPWVLMQEDHFTVGNVYEKALHRLNLKRESFKLSDFLAVGSESVDYLKEDAPQALSMIIQARQPGQMGLFFIKAAQVILSDGDITGLSQLSRDGSRILYKPLAKLDYSLLDETALQLAVTQSSA